MKTLNNDDDHEDKSVIKDSKRTTERQIDPDVHEFRYKGRTFYVRLNQFNRQRVIQGYMKKLCHEDSYLFSTCFEIRFCIMDLNNMVFKYAKTPRDDFSFIDMEELVTCNFEDPQRKKPIKVKKGQQCDMKYLLYLIGRKRTYVMSANTRADQVMWFNGFQVFFKVKHVINLVKNGAAFSRQNQQIQDEARNKRKSNPSKQSELKPKTVGRMSTGDANKSVATPKKPEDSAEKPSKAHLITDFKNKLTSPESKAKKLASGKIQNTKSLPFDNEVDLLGATSEKATRTIPMRITDENIKEASEAKETKPLSDEEKKNFIDRAQKQLQSNFLKAIMIEDPSLREFAINRLQNIQKEVNKGEDLDKIDELMADLPWKSDSPIGLKNLENAKEEEQGNKEISVTQKELQKVNQKRLEQEAELEKTKIKLEEIKRQKSLQSTQQQQQPVPREESEYEYEEYYAEESDYALDKKSHEASMHQAEAAHIELQAESIEIKIPLKKTAHDVPSLKNQAAQDEKTLIKIDNQDASNDDKIPTPIQRKNQQKDSCATKPQEQNQKVTMKKQITQQKQKVTEQINDAAIGPIKIELAVDGKNQPTKTTFNQVQEKQISLQNSEQLKVQTQQEKMKPKLKNTQPQAEVNLSQQPNSNAMNPPAKTEEEKTKNHMIDNETSKLESTVEKVSLSNQQEPIVKLIYPRQDSKQFQQKRSVKFANRLSTQPSEASQSEQATKLYFPKQATTATSGSQSLQQQPFNDSQNNQQLQQQQDSTVKHILGAQVPQAASALCFESISSINMNVPQDPPPYQQASTVTAAVQAATNIIRYDAQPLYHSAVDRRQKSATKGTSQTSAVVQAQKPQTTEETKAVNLPQKKVEVKDMLQSLETIQIDETVDSVPQPNPQNVVKTNTTSGANLQQPVQNNRLEPAQLQSSQPPYQKKIQVNFAAPSRFQQATKVNESRQQTSAEFEQQSVNIPKKMVIQPFESNYSSMEKVKADAQTEIKAFSDNDSEEQLTLIKDKKDEEQVVKKKQTKDCWADIFHARNNPDKQQSDQADQTTKNQMIRSVSAQQNPVPNQQQKIVLVPRVGQQNGQKVSLKQTPNSSSVLKTQIPTKPQYQQTKILQKQTPQQEIQSKQIPQTTAMEVSESLKMQQKQQQWKQSVPKTVIANEKEIQNVPIDQQPQVQQPVVKAVDSTAIAARHKRSKAQDNIKEAELALGSAKQKRLNRWMPPNHGHSVDNEKSKRLRRSQGTAKENICKVQKFDNQTNSFQEEAAKDVKPFKSNNGEKSEQQESLITRSQESIYGSMCKNATSQLEVQKLPNPKKQKTISQADNKNQNQHQRTKASSNIQQVDLIPEEKSQIQPVAVSPPQIFETSEIDPKVPTTIQEYTNSGITSEPPLDQYRAIHLTTEIAKKQEFLQNDERYNLQLQPKVFTGGRQMTQKQVKTRRRLNITRMSNPNENSSINMSVGTNGQIPSQQNLSMQIPQQNQSSLSVDPFKIELSQEYIQARKYFMKSSLGQPTYINQQSGLKSSGRILKVVNIIGTSNDSEDGNLSAKRVSSIRAKQYKSKGEKVLFQHTGSQESLNSSLELMKASGFTQVKLSKIDMGADYTCTSPDRTSGGQLSAPSTVERRKINHHARKNLRLLAGGHTHSSAVKPKPSGVNFHPSDNDSYSLNRMLNEIDKQDNNKEESQNNPNVPGSPRQAYQNEVGYQSLQLSRNMLGINAGEHGISQQPSQQHKKNIMPHQATVQIQSQQQKSLRRYKHPKSQRQGLFYSSAEAIPTQSTKTNNQETSNYFPL